MKVLTMKELMTTEVNTAFIAVIGYYDTVKCKDVEYKFVDTNSLKEARQYVSNFPEEAMKYMTVWASHVVPTEIVQKAQDWYRSLKLEDRPINIEVDPLSRKGYWKSPIVLGWRVTITEQLGYKNSEMQFTVHGPVNFVFNPEYEYEDYVYDIPF